jgi:hypothetical protein
MLVQMIKREGFILISYFIVLICFHRSRVRTIQVFILAKTTNGDWMVSKVSVLSSTAILGSNWYSKESED